MSTAPVSRATPRRPSVIVVDAGLLDDDKGHHLSFARGIAAAAAGRGLSARVYGAAGAVRSLRRHLPFVPLFRNGVYDIALAAGWEEATYLGQNAAYRADLTKIEADLPDGPVVLVFSTVMHNQLAAIGDWMRHLTRQGRAAAGVIQLMMAPKWAPADRRNEQGPDLYRRAIAACGDLPGRRLFLVAENGAIADEYRDLLGVDVETLHFPSPAAGAASSSRAAGAPVTIAYVGHSRPEKGYHLLPEIAHRLRSYPRAKLMLHVHHNGEAHMLETEARLRAECPDAMRTGSLSPAEYARFIAGADVLLLPYDAVSYGARGSGVLMEAAVAGKPVVVPAGSGMAADLESGLAAGTTFDSFDAPAIVAGIGRLLDDYDGHRARAATAALVARGLSNHETYLDRVLAYLDRAGAT